MTCTSPRLRQSCLLLGVLSLTVAPGNASDVGSAFTYQGELTLNGTPVSNTCDFQFSLWTSAVFGSQVGATQALNNVTVTGGHFTVPLDFGAAAFAGQARWLRIDVRSPAGGGAFTTLNPRQELTPTPYAIGLALPYAGSDDDAGNSFSMTNSGLGRAGSFSISNAANNSAALNAVTVGAGALSAAVRGQNLALNTQSIGVWGSAAGPGWGLYGQTPSGRGVFGEATSSGFGLYGLSNGTAGVGAYGLHSSGSGTAAGVFGETLSFATGAAGVYGRATTPSGLLTYGVFGESLGATGTGVRGQCAGGTGVHGLHTATTGTNPGVLGETSSTSAGAVGVIGRTPGHVTQLSFGVYGESGSTTGVGVYGTSAIGVHGVGNAYGVKGEASDSSSTGVWALGSGGALSQPALRADNSGGPAIEAYGRTAIRGEGDDAGVVGVTFDEDGVGGSFTNFDGGTALRVDGKAEVIGTVSCNVLEILGGGDLAERFEFSESASPGMVVEIDLDRPGKLCLSRSAYNKRVAGVISGANALNAGVVLGIQPAGDRNLPIALSGRVWVHCDTRDSGVAPGDLLTTSDLPGHAMRVADNNKAQGAIIGKAMSELPQGQSGMVLVLVNLQ